ncbi:MAG TPA: hypothetical protein VGD45_19555 [Steroidobacter sp.]|uniref:hypothetical protein n=1 Tax=Steroidobacter sp. TaxID=1978227 RepID=UPI002ED92002
MYFKSCFVVALLSLISWQNAAAFTHSCEYGPPPAGSPPSLSNPAVYARLDWTLSENPTANGLFMQSRAWDPTNTDLGTLQLVVPLPASAPGWWIHAVAFGSPIPVGEYRVGSQATAFVYVYFEGALWMVEIGYLSACQAAGHIP